MKVEMVDVVRQLVGPIQPIGETNSDRQRLDNLLVLIDILEDLLEDVRKVALESDRSESSVRAIGYKARDFLNELKD